MGYLFVIGAILSMVLSNTTKKLFNKECPIFFAFICCVFADVFFVFSAGFKFDFNSQVLIYAILFAVAYSLATLFIIFAYKVGSFSFSGLAISYSLLLPTLYGIIILKNQTSLFFYIGLVLLCIAIYLITIDNKKEKKNQTEKSEKVFNLKWLVFIAIAFVANGFCTIFQTAEQNALNNMYKYELMIIALTISAVVFLILSLFLEKNGISYGTKQALEFGSISGLLNGALNLCVMYSVNYLKASIVFPLISGGGLVLTFVIARIFFKEKYTLIQYIGFVVSIATVVLLNL